MVDVVPRGKRTALTARATIGGEVLSHFAIAFDM